MSTRQFFIKRHIYQDNDIRFKCMNSSIFCNYTKIIKDEATYTQVREEFPKETFISWDDISVMFHNKKERDVGPESKYEL